jgi:chemotaxis protein methyltransferase WspC
MFLEKIQDILYNTIGLHAKTIGSSTVLHAINERIQSCKLNDIESYHSKLIEDKDELTELIEEVVIPETWFFRDIEPFKMLIKFVNDEWLKNQPSGPLRVLSIPCATGEEPYSIAMALLDAGLTPSQVYIDAVDVSNRNIKRCRQAHYREHSFRGVDPLAKKRFFRLREDNLYHPDILIKAMVNFDQASILDAQYIHSQRPYDVVFCRNLLIYFDDKTQQNTADMLSKLLKPTGILFVGHAETGRFMNNQDWSISYKYPRSFAIRKFIDDARFENKKRIKNIIKKPVNKPYIRNKISAKKTQPTTIKRTVNKTTPTKKVKSTIALPDINYAQKLADQGKFTEAESICLDSLTINKQDSKAYFLLALIQIATGDERKAVQYFRNVVYLEPHNFDALMYLSTLIGQQGDPKQSQRFRERAQRCQKQH